MAILIIIFLFNLFLLTNYFFIMKKLFTLFALLACFMGANAVELLDFTLDYTQAGKSAVGWKDGAIQDDWITADEDGLHLYNPEVMENFWSYQLWIASGADLEKEQTYTIKIVAKVSDGEAHVRCKIGDWGGGISGDIYVNSTEYQEYTYTGSGSADSWGLFVQFGDYVGTLSFQSLTITHEGKEQKPVNWENILLNGDASQAWPNPNAQVVNNQYDSEDAKLVSAFGKEYGRNENNPHAADIEDGAFVCQTAAVNPPLVWEEDGEQWGTQHSAGDPKPDNEWQNQFWINFPRPLTDGEPVKVSFKYKASENARVTTQDHRAPGDYLGGGKYGELNFTTEWQTYTKEFSAADGVQSIAFNLGEDKQYEKEIKFYFDELNLSVMVLEKGFFAAAINTDGGSTVYDFDEAVKFAEEPDPDDPDGKLYVGTVGVKGDKNSWVNQVMISTAYGNDKGYKAATVALSGRVKEGEWISYSPKAQSKIDLPAAGVWTITVAPSDGLMMFTQEEGDKPKDPVDITTNTEIFVVEAVERDDKADEVEGGTGQPWDNQFWIAANRPLKKGEVSVVEFDYKSAKDAKTTTQCHKIGDDGKPCTYIHWNAIGDVEFTTESQSFSKTFTVDKEADGMISIAFNMAEIKEANTYTISNVKWYLQDDELNANGQTLENLIDAAGTQNFWIKIGAGTAPYLYGTEAGITNVVNNKTVTSTSYNLAGQKVDKNFKGIVVKDGKKFVNK
jgi:hypothetical protein